MPIDRLTLTAGTGSTAPRTSTRWARDASTDFFLGGGLVKVFLTLFSFLQTFKSL
jgi:hypothetical protein